MKIKVEENLAKLMTTMTDKIAQREPLIKLKNEVQLQWTPCI